MSPMASSPFLLSFFFIFLFINPSHQRNSYSSSSSSSSSNSSSYYPKHSFSPQKIPQIHFACKATRYPNSCEAFLSKSNLLPQDPTSKRIIQSAISVSIDHLKTAQSMVKSILDTSSDNKNRSNVAASCLLILDLSQRRYESAADVLPRGKIKDARAWTSAALSYQSGCRSSLKNVKGTKLVAETMSFLDTLIELTSNALSMMMSLDNFGEDLREWRAPKTERIGFWERGRSSGISKLGFKGGLPSKLTSDVTVCKDGSCKYKTVQDAVNAAPDNVATRRFVIHIKSGVYEEIVRVPFEKKNVVLLGEGMGKTVITGSLNVGQPEMTTYNSATVGVVGDGFMASGLTIKNSAGPDAHQAVAFRSDSDLSIIQNCEFLGYQDTLYAHSLRQFYKNCRILGNVDFIFGNAAAIFKDCLILVVPRQVGPEKGENNAVTAHGRTDPAQSTGFVFENCVINGTDGYMKLYHSNPVVHKNYLGRPWKEYARTVFIHCTLEVLINPDGWMPWSGDLALKTLYYGEFHNAGPGSNVSKRVSWSNQIPEEHVSTYSVHNFIQGDNWISKSS